MSCKMGKSKKDDWEQYIANRAVFLFWLGFYKEISIEPVMILSSRFGLWPRPVILPSAY